MGSVASDGASREAWCVGCVSVQSNEELRSSGGFSLVEILISLVIVGLMLFVVIPSTNRIFHTELRSSVRKFVSVGQALYSEAVLTRKLYRLVIDLDNNAYWAEVSTGKTLIMTRNEDVDLEDDSDYAEFQKGFAKYEAHAIKEAELPMRVKFLDVMNEALYGTDVDSGQPRAVTGGIAYIFFFPHGEVNPALIHISEEFSEDVSYTIEFLPISGSARLYAGYAGHNGEDIERVKE